MMHIPNSNNTAPCRDGGRVSDVPAARRALSSQQDIVRELRGRDQMRREAKERLDVEIFNHYFFGFTGNG